MDCSTPGLCPSPSPEIYPSSCPLHQWCHPAISYSDTLFSFWPIFPSIRNFSNESAVCIRWPKYWSFSFSISPSYDHSEFLSVKTDWLDLFAVQVTLRSILQNHSSKTSILLCSTFFTVQALTTMHDHWENDRLDYMDICWLSNVSAFQHTV